MPETEKGSGLRDKAPGVWRDNGPVCGFRWRWASKAEGRSRLEASIASGAALEKFREMSAAQGGEVLVVYEPMRLPHIDV